MPGGKHSHSWWWIFWDVLIGARNPAGAVHWSKAKLIQMGWKKSDQKCPRRYDGPFNYGDADWWDHDRWGWEWSRKLAYWLNNGPVGKLRHRIRDHLWDLMREREYDRLGMFAKRIADRFFNQCSGGDRWEWRWQPRTCSYCGGVHPDDAIRLISEGWRSGGTTKSYKRYLEPSGKWSPVPPVKLYVHHFDDEHIKRFNAALDAYRKRS